MPVFFVLNGEKKSTLLVKTRYLVITCYVLLLFCDINWLKYEFSTINPLGSAWSK